MSISLTKKTFLSSRWYNIMFNIYDKLLFSVSCRFLFFIFSENCGKLSTKTLGSFQTTKLFHRHYSQLNLVITSLNLVENSVKFHFINKSFWCNKTKILTNENKWVTRFKHIFYITYTILANFFPLKDKFFLYTL